MPKFLNEEHRDEATDFPQPGRWYVIQQRDSAQGLSGISAKLFGTGRRWREIWRINKHKARSSDPNRSYWVGDIILMPGDPIVEEKIEDMREDVDEYLFDVARNDITIIIDGVRIPAVSASVLSTFDTAADGWTAIVPWDPTNEERRRLFRPFGYQSAECYVGGNLMIRGYLYTVTPKISNQGRSIQLEGWSLTADIIDSSMRPPYEVNKITLQDRAKQLAGPMGLGVVFNVDEDEPFDRVTASPEDTILSHLADLAKQRGIQISTTSQGRLLFHRADATGTPVAALIEGYPPFREAQIAFDGRSRFSSYTARSQSPGKNSKTATSNDGQVPAQRQITFSADEAQAGDLQGAADWQRSKQLGESLTLEIPTDSWYNPQSEDGDLWRNGQLVTVISPTLFLDDGFDFLIQKVEYILEEGGDGAGATARLTLVPPQVYTGGELEDPWSE